MPNKFIFPVGTQSGLNELWESDGTNANTKVFKVLMGPDFSFLFCLHFTAPFNQLLFQGK
jgi:ELWxxDGT repeat protein